MMCCAVLATDAEFIERETNLNCLMYALEELRGVWGCFFELGRKDIVARFVSVCRSAAKLSLEDRIHSVVSALKNALEMANEISGKTALSQWQSKAVRVFRHGLERCALTLVVCIPEPV